ncbi:YhgN family NAAT transporter [Permianibacter sp. IMCC34836]|uniref:YhgN family NAAT transporter n=1 Tax=Permianibacter fluminis TaxID=2738515 RepID=UPI001555650C|nr:YhgN family NAAT transporter [Permianibacter fluminis]NQD35443.1 YhgN family NAAT transporter [Permianibacter fluminis]
MDFISATLTLFLVMDPLGNVPMFLALLKDLEPKRRRKVILREMLIALLIMALFLFFGSSVLGFLGLKAETISIAGGIVLFLIALRMVFPQEGGVMGEMPGGEPFIVPLAIPFVAGPSTLATLILFSQQQGHLLESSGAMLVAWFATAVILIYSTKFYKILGDRGLAAMERLMGMLLIMIAVQMLLNGVLEFAADFGYQVKH